MKRNNQVTFLFVIWVVLWGTCAAFTYYLYMEGSKYPVEAVGTDRMQDAMYGIYAIICATWLLSVIWFFAWKAFRRNQKAFDSTLTAQEKTTPHSWIDTSLPLSLHGTILQINRGFSVQSIDISGISRIHSRAPLFHKGLPALVIDIYAIGGRKYKALFDYRNAYGVRDILEQIRQKNPHIVIHDAYFNLDSVRSYEFFQQFIRENAKRKTEVSAGLLSEEQYIEWLRQQKSTLDNISQ